MMMCLVGEGEERVGLEREEKRSYVTSYRQTLSDISISATGPVLVAEHCSTISATPCGALLASSSHTRNGLISAS